MRRSHATLHTELGSARSDISREEGVIRNSAGRVCTGCLSLVRPGSTIYSDCLDSVLATTQIRGEYLGRFCMRVAINDSSLHIEDVDRDEGCGGRTQSQSAADE